ncbi:MAG TPA: peptidyl-prolyl cis-trans isomerase [Thermoleophilia bacterium]|nr:peptidyl-prolyl cis-trans isomerase [Thermoleophilia bacterium]
MKRLVLAVALVVLLAVSLSVAACGGNEVPAGAIAAVGDGVVTQEQFDELMAQAKAQYASQAGVDFPKEGSPTYNQLVASIVNYLVQNELIKQKAEELDVTVSDKELAERLKQVEQSVGGAKKLKKLLKSYAMTVDQLKEQLRASMLADAVKQKVYEDVKVSDEKVKAYYDDPKNESQFKQPETRDTRHILVKTKAQADEVRALLAADPSEENWQKVAKKYSQDPGSKDSGGALGAVSKGQMVPGFEKATWALKVDEISRPVKTQFGWHIIQVIKITPAKTQTFAEAKEMIRQMLLYQQQATAWSDWLKQAMEDADIVYAAGYDPDKLTAPATPATSPSPSATE